MTITMEKLLSRVACTSYRKSDE